MIDKDRASALLARELGADRLVILTEVPAVYSGFGTERQEELRELSADEAEALLPELAAGSMRPKLEASVDFVRATGQRSADHLPRGPGRSPRRPLGHTHPPVGRTGSVPPANQAHYDSGGRRECHDHCVLG